MLQKFLSVYKEQYALIAGQINSVEVPTSAKIYDLQTGKYTALPSLPAGYFVEWNTVIEGKFYCALRMKNNMTTDDQNNKQRDLVLYQLYRLDLSAPKKWETIGNLKICIKNKIQSVSDGSKLFIIGGKETYFNYDEGSDEIVIFSSPKSLDLVYSSVVVQDKIYVIGTSQDGNTCLEIYDIFTKKWSLDHDRMIDCNYLKYCTVYSIERWIVFVDCERVRLIYDTCTEEWFQNEDCFTISTEFDILGSAVLGGTRIAFFGRLQSEKETNILTIERKHIIPNWYIRKDIILLRALVKDDRAYPVATNTKNDVILQELIMSLYSDLFKFILTFL